MRVCIQGRRGRSGLPCIVVYETVRGEHLKHMGQLDEHLADGASFWDVLCGNLSHKHKSYLTKQPTFNRKCALNRIKTCLSAVVGTVFGEDVVDLRLLDGAEHQCLPIVSGPVVEVPHANPGEVHIVGVQRLQVHVLHHVLQDTKVDSNHEYKQDS